MPNSIYPTLHSPHDEAFVSTAPGPERRVLSAQIRLWCAEQGLPPIAAVAHLNRLRAAHQYQKLQAYAQQAKREAHAQHLAAFVEQERKRAILEEQARQASITKHAAQGSSETEKPAL